MNKFIIIFLFFLLLIFVFIVMNYDTIIQQIEPEQKQPQIEPEQKQPQIEPEQKQTQSQSQEIQQPSKIQTQLQQQLLLSEQLLTQQKELLTERQQKELEPVDCVGYYENIGEGNCVIDRCDPSNNIVGLGKKKQRFNITTQPKNLGVQCPEREIEVDCSKNAYSECVKCNMNNGGYYTTSECNITKCLKDTDTGLGTKFHTWISPSLPVPLQNCIMPKEELLSCAFDKFSNCNCQYTYDIPKICNIKNTVCDNKNSSCSFDYTKILPLEDGICTTKFEYPKITTNDGNCNCIVDRTFGEWEYTNERCDPDNRSTLLASKRSRQIKITKPNESYEGCSFAPLKNEVILETDRDKAFLNSNEDFQFRPKVSTFNTVQTETNIIFPDSQKCKCEGSDTSLNTSYTEWGQWDKACPSRTDYTKSDRDFTISRTRTRAYKTNTKLTNESCYQSNKIYTQQTEDNILCPRDCSGNYNNEYSECKNIFGLPIDCTINTTGYESGVKIKSFNIFKSDLNSGVECKRDIPQSCVQECPVDCVGNYIDAGEGTCVVDRCDATNNIIGKGYKKKIFDTVIYPQHLGDGCPDLEKYEECSVYGHSDCIKCNATNGGGHYITGECNITSCLPGTEIGIGTKNHEWIAESLPVPLENCIMPQIEPLNCKIDDFKSCNCQYIFDNIPQVCNKTNTVCDNKNSSCSYDYKQVLPLKDGICTTVFEYPKITTNDGNCNCIVDRSLGEWQYTEPDCDQSNPTTFIAKKRSREITITKPFEGYEGCSFRTWNNEVIIDADRDKGFLNSNQDFQFRSNNSTFKTIQTETNINFPNHEMCLNRQLTGTTGMTGTLGMTGNTGITGITGPTRISTNPVLPIKETSSGNKYVVFNYTSDNVGLTGQTEYTFTVLNNDLINTMVLIVAGGGGGGFAGGGGGGGDVSLNNITIPVGSHKIRVGKGGLGSSENQSSEPGYNSSIILQSGIEYTYCGGGGGGTWSRSPTPALYNLYSSGGGGGGGGGGNSIYSSGGTGNNKSGNGGNGGLAPIGTGGGGGCSNPGTNGSSNEKNGNGNGGFGILSNITGENVGYGGGGGGGARGNGQPDTCIPGSGFDGGGNGAYYKTYGAVAGKNGTGGGGGGGGWSSDSLNEGAGANGGHGVVIIRI